MKRLLTTLIALAACIVGNAKVPSALPRQIETGYWRAGHIQGIAVDNERKHIYYSFTTMLIKADINGNIVGSVTGLLGHLGCITYNEEDGRIYGSLEYKNDAIGQGILKREGATRTLEDGFYIAIFDVEKITRLGMSAERDGVMTSVFLPTVLDDFKASVALDGVTHKHRLGCSGIDGVSFGPKFGSSKGRKLLTVAYGVYGDSKRADNNHQVLLQYDTHKWVQYEAPLSQEAMHRNGPTRPDGEYFVYTGNTRYGVQNMAYDSHRRLWFMAVYKGKKPEFANFSLFAADGTQRFVKRPLEGVPYIKRGRVVPLADIGARDPRHATIRGWHFDAATGICPLGDDYFYISHNRKTKEGQGSTIRLYRFTGDADRPFEPVL